MKKLSMLLLAALLLIWAFASGGFSSGKEIFNSLGEKSSSVSFITRSGDSVLHQAQADAPEGTLLYVINSPTEEELNDIVSYQLLRLDDDAPTTLLVPAKAGTRVQIYRLDSDGSRGGEVWSTESSDKGLVIAAGLLYGEAGAPAYEVYLEAGKQYASYFFAGPDEGEPEKFIFVSADGELLPTNNLD